MIMKKKENNMVPQHVGIIMDGNRRWARKHGLKAVLGHKKAAEAVIEPLIEKAGEMEIKFLTFWCFSTENWKRDALEIRGLMDVFRYVLETKLQRFKEKGAKIIILGDLSKFPHDIRKKVERGMEETKENTAITVNFALNYGGREEIVRAINKTVTSRQGTSKKLDKKDEQVTSLQGKSDKLDEITEEEFGKYLDTAGQPDPDLIIRTGGEMRLSGFMPWQSIYAELYFTETYFPDFSPTEFEKAIGEYQKRQRRFGR